MENAHVYFLPGLGTDERVFEKLSLKATSVNYLPFKNPYRGEKIQEYAQRMAEPITQKRNVVLVGLSFGGMLAQEIAAGRNVDKLVLVSTVKHSSEIPIWMRLGKFLPAHKIPIPVKFRSATVRFWGKAFGTQNATATLMFKNMLEQYSDHYYRWSTEQIIRWKEVEHNRPVLHIHGDNDLIFPLGNINGCTVIKGGTHSMIYTHAEIVSQHINTFIAEETMEGKRG